MSPNRFLPSKKQTIKPSICPSIFFCFSSYRCTGASGVIRRVFTPITNLKSPVAQACVSLLWLKKPKSPKDFIKLPVPRPAIFHYFWCVFFFFFCWFFCLFVFLHFFIHPSIYSFSFILFFLKKLWIGGISLYLNTYVDIIVAKTVCMFRSWLVGFVQGNIWNFAHVHLEQRFPLFA